MKKTVKLLPALPLLLLLWLLPVGCADEESNLGMNLVDSATLFDGKNDTYWHTAWGANEPQCPHTIVIDMAKTYLVTAITYLSRQDGNQNGMVKDFEVYLSTDGKQWGSAVVTGQLKNTTALQTASLKTPVAARYMKFVAKSEINGNAWTSAAEISIEAAADVTAISDIPMEPAQASTIFNLQGLQLPEKPAKGVYIAGGKKRVATK